MSQPELLPGEQVVMSSLDNVLILTNLRVKYEAANSGTSAYKAIPLEKVSACALTTKKYIVLLVIAALFLLGAFSANSSQASGIAVVAAIAFAIAYYFTRNGQLEVISDAGFSIAVPTKGLKHEDVRRFADALSLEISKLR